MYRVFEALDELGAIVEEAKGLPMTSGCVVPRGDVLDLLDDIKDAIPTELDNAQDVLDEKDGLINAARKQAQEELNHAEKESHEILATAKAEADRLVNEARNYAQRVIVDADNYAQDKQERTHEECERLERTAAREYEASTNRAHAESERLLESGNALYERTISEAIAEQQRLVSDTEVVRAAHAEAERVVDAAHAETNRLRSECDTYVDAKLAEFEEALTATMRTVGRGRKQLRTNAGVHDYADDFAKQAS